MCIAHVHAVMYYNVHPQGIAPVYIAASHSKHVGDQRLPNYVFISVYTYV